MSLRNRSRAGSRPGSRVGRECSRFSISSDPTALADARLKNVSNQVDHFSKWFDCERSQYEQVQRSRPSTSSGVGQGRARTGAPGQTRAGCGLRVVEQKRHHAGSVQPHLQTGADLGWLAGAGTKAEVVARSQSTTPTATAAVRGHPRDSQSPIPAAASASRPGTANSMFTDHKDGKWIASVTPPPLTPNTRLTLDSLGETREKRARDLHWRESSLGPAHHAICPANMMPMQRVDPSNWGPQVSGRQADHTIGLGASHGKLKETWATNTWRNELSDDSQRSSRPIRVDNDPSRHVIYDHTSGGKVPGRPAGGDKSHGGLLAQRGMAFFY